MKLQSALDAVLGPPDMSLPLEDALTEDILTKLKDCEYLRDVINEGLRLHSTVGFGLPRVVPEGGMTILGHTFAPGTIVSIPGYALHLEKSIWGEDADMFNPDRWSMGDKEAMGRAFVPFSVGPRCFYLFTRRRRGR
jgi:benzoate 4-monooxygenase